MLDCAAFCQALQERELTFFTGVPDSLLAPLCAYIDDQLPPQNHLVAANEGNAAALAAGHYLATGEPAVVYMQNSGQGNAVNPLVSLAAPEVYRIPMLLLIGWRGEPGRPDEPQHAKQGAITFDLLQTLGVEADLLPQELDQAREKLTTAVQSMRRHLRPYALVAQRDTFAPYEPTRLRGPSPYPLRREQVVKTVAAALDPLAAVVSTTGKTSRELYEVRGARPGPDFLTVGSMGHASQIALGIALAQPERPVLCMDGDGALIMHMGGLAVIGQQGPSNFKHLVLNNGAHDSVGGQATAGFHIDIPAIARACGYATALRADSSGQLQDRLDPFLQALGPALLEVRVGPGARPDLGRPSSSPQHNKERFMEFLRP